MREYVNKFIEYVRSGGEKNENTKHLKETFATLAVNRGEWFRAMNVILTKQWASLLLDTVSANLFIHVYYIQGPF